MNIISKLLRRQGHLRYRSLRCLPAERLGGGLGLVLSRSRNTGKHPHKPWVYPGAREPVNLISSVKIEIGKFRIYKHLVIGA